MRTLGKYMIQPKGAEMTWLCGIYRIVEELDTKIAVGEKLTTIEYDYPEFHLCMECFLSAVKEGSLVLKEHEDARWLNKNELDTVRWLPADQMIIDLLKINIGPFEEKEK